MDLLFEQNIGARESGKASADPFHGEAAEKAAEEAVTELTVEKV